MDAGAEHADSLVECARIVLAAANGLLNKNIAVELDRTQKRLPLFPGRLKTLTHDDKRNGITTLFAAIVFLPAG